MLALKLSREMEQRLHKYFGTTDSDPRAITLRDAMTSLGSLGSLCLLQYTIDEKRPRRNYRSRMRTRQKS